MRQLDKKYVNIDSYDVYQWRTMNVLATFCATDFLDMEFFYVLFTTSLPFFFRMILPSSKTVRSYFCDMLTPFHLKCFSLVLFHALCLQNENFKRNFKRIE